MPGSFPPVNADQIVAVIPARFGSTRFPGKPLLSETGKYLIQHVYEAVRQSREVGKTVVATDDERIAQAVRSFGGRAVITRPDHATGTDRVAECAVAMCIPDDGIVLNVQGDEPEIDPEHLDLLIRRMRQEPDCGMGTLACPFPSDGPREGPGSPLDPNCVKVVVDSRGLATYFSRSLIPYPRDSGGRVDHPERWLLHIGIYAFRARALRRFTRMTPSAEPDAIEFVEKLEQLRAVSLEHDAANGIGPISVVRVDRAAIGIDTPEDYAAFVERQSRRLN